MDINTIVASGMQALRTKHAAHADNVANAQTPGYQRLAVRTTERPQGGVDLSVQRESSRVSDGVRGELPPVSADDGSPAGSTFEVGRVDSAESAPADEVAAEAAEAEAGQSSRIDETVAQAAGADLVSDMVGMNEAARGMEMLAAVYDRHDDALGTMLDAFG